MEWLYYLLLVLVGMGGAFVQRVSGFGLGIFAMIFMPHFMPSPTIAAAIISICSGATTVFNAFKYRKNINYKISLPMICASLVIIPIAVYFSAVVSGKIFKILLGIVLVLLSLYFLFFDSKIKIRPTTVNGVFAGTLSGALVGLFSTGGPPVVLYLSKATTDNLIYFATVQFFFAITSVYATGMRVFNGLIDMDVVLYSLVCLAGCMIGDFIGSKVFDKLNSKKLKLIIYIGMIISGAIMFF